MPVERDSNSISWLEDMLASAPGPVRRRVIELLEYVDCPQRAGWLKSAAVDPDPRVAATAVLVQAVLAARDDDDMFELWESDFASAVTSDELTWEWEYRIRVCLDRDVARGDVVVWSTVEDDSTAKRLAIMKVGAASDASTVAFVVSRRYVTQFTRSAKSHKEAERWQAEGRPRYRDG